MKLVKRILLSVAFLLVLSFLLLTIAYGLAHSDPDWYQPTALSQELRDAASRRATNKLAALQNHAAEARALETRIRTGRTSATMPSEIVVSFTDDELNSFFQTWQSHLNWRASYEKRFTDPVILVREGKLILAARIKDLDIVTSIHVQPGLDSDGRLRLEIVRVLGGKLPLPRAILDRYSQHVINSVAARVPAWRAWARIDETGSANNPAIYAAMAELLINTFENRSSEAVLFVPILDESAVPVRIVDLQIENNALTMRVLPMSEPERTALLKSIQTNQQR
jgi:hypothetical protein